MARRKIRLIFLFVAYEWLPLKLITATQLDQTINETDIGFLAKYRSVLINQLLIIKLERVQPACIFLRTSHYQEPRNTWLQ